MLLLLSRPCAHRRQRSDGAHIIMIFRDEVSDDILGLSDSTWQPASLDQFYPQQNYFLRDETSDDVFRGLTGSIWQPDDSEQWRAQKAHQNQADAGEYAAERSFSDYDAAWISRMQRSAGAYGANIAWPEYDLCSLPSFPSADLSPSDVALHICASSQHAYFPTPRAGMARLHAFTDQRCSLGSFASLTELYQLPGCRSFTMGDPLILHGTTTRASTCTVAVEVEVHRQDADALGSTFRYVINLEQARYPPFAECWLFQGLFPWKQHLMLKNDRLR